MKFYERYHSRPRELRQIGLGLWLLCVFTQKILRIDAGFPFLKNFTSRALATNISVENNSWSVRKSFIVNGGCYYHTHAGIKIGEGTIWSYGVKMITLDHVMKSLDEGASRGEIVIGRNCWIGAGSVILGGVVLGDNTIVGANSVVNKSFEDGNIVIAGSPAKIIKTL